MDIIFNLLPQTSSNINESKKESSVDVMGQQQIITREEEVNPHQNDVESIPGMAMKRLTMLGGEAELAMKRLTVLGDEAEVAVIAAEKEIVDKAHYYRRYLTTVLYKSLSESMWVNIDTLPKTWIRIMSVISISIYLGIFAYYTVDSYMSGMTDTFLAPDVNAGICVNVPKVVDAKLHISVGADGLQGFYDHMSQYQPNTTAYLLELSGFEVHSESDFSTFVEEVNSNLLAVALKGKRRNLAWNYIVWAAYTYRIASADHGSFRFSLVGNLDTLYNQQTNLAQIAGSQGPCGIDFAVRFDISTSSFSITASNFFSNKQNNSFGICPGVIDPEKFGYDVKYLPTFDLTLSVDMRTVVLATAVNIDIISLSALELTTTSSNLTFPEIYCNMEESNCGGLKVSSFRTYFSVASNFLGASKIYCVTWLNASLGVDAGSTCFLRVGDVMIFPTTNHWERCDCAAPNFNHYLCQQPDILTGLFFVNGEDFSNFPRTLDILGKIRAESNQESLNGDMYANNYFFNSSLGTITQAYPLNSVWRQYSPDQIKNYFREICFPDVNCSMIVVESWSSSQVINEYNFVVQKPACHASYYSNSSFNEMVANQKYAIHLSEAYYICTMRTEDNIVFSLGISIGNAGLGCAVLMFILFFFLGRYLKYTINYTTGFDRDLGEQGMESSEIASIRSKLDEMERLLRKQAQRIRDQKDIIMQLCSKTGIDIDIPNDTLSTQTPKFRMIENQMYQEYLESMLKKPI